MATVNCLVTSDRPIYRQGRYIGRYLAFLFFFKFFCLADAFDFTHLFFDPFSNEFKFLTY